MSEINQTIADLSPEKRALLTLRLKKKRAAAAKERAIPRREDRDTFPLSFAQQRLWFLDQYEPDSPFYNIPTAVRLRGPLDVTALEQSLDEIVRRHEVLRAMFVTEKGQPVQVIAPELRVNLAPVDLVDLPASRREAEVFRLAVEEARQPFDLKRGPLFRVRLFRLDREDHVVLLTIHHIVSDGWSMNVLIQELMTLYDAFAAGKPAPLPELPVQYADYAHWQREWLQGETLERQLEYWRERLGDGPPVLELPTDRPRPAVQTHRGAYHTFQLPAPLSQALKALSREQGVTLFMTLLAAFQTLLHRYTRQTDISVGTPIANRNRAEIEGLIGFFANTIVLRTDLSGELSFRELLQRVKEVALGAYAHQDVPFEMLVDELQPERSLSHTPFFQVVFALQDALAERIELSGLTLSPLEVESGTAKFDLTLFMEEQADGLKGMLEYNTDLFDAATMERLGLHFRSLLESIVADPDRSIATLPLLTESERARLLGEWSGVRTDYPRQETIQRLFEAQVERTPDAPAVTFATNQLSSRARRGTTNQLTYHQLNQRANQLAHYLKSLGVGPEVLVGIFMERSLEMVIAHLAILKAGGAYLPLDPEYPHERLTFMLQDGQVPVLLTQERMLERLPDHDARVISLDRDWATINREPAGNPDSGATADSLAYVMYTSGSTGRPKGVAVVHRGVVRLVQETNYADLGADQVFLQLAPISFDAATLEIWGPLLNGGRLVVMSAHAPSLIEIGQTVERYGVTILWLTASLFHLMVDERLEDLGGLRQLLAGGDVLSVSHVRRVVETLEGVRMINGYGPTENTTFSTTYPVTDPDDIRKTVPIGRPIANTLLYILDAHMQPVPTGVAGELYVGGDGLARGYLSRPELTAERFIPDPHTEEAGARLYKTGDLARFLPEGNVEFLGRMDHQVKVRGFRIELGEIQTVLGQHPQVRDAVVLAREDLSTGKRLVGYVVPEDGQLDLEHVRGFLREKLPEYMVPSALVPMDAFPISPNGKVDRRALPAPQRSRADMTKAYAPPRTAVECYLVAHWQDVLGIDRVGIRDNFFELGGDSLQAAVLINRLQEELDQTAHVHVKALFMAPTVAEMALYMAEYYPEAVAKIDTDATAADLEYVFEQEIAVAGEIERVDASTILQMRELIPPLQPRREGETGDATKNPPAVFILSPPRSGSTLLRTMLTGHPRLFAPPELDLLSFNTLQERKAAFTGEYSFWLRGPIRAIMALKDCDVETATAIMRDYEEQNLTTQQFYALLQEWLGDRLLVDKTPVYPLDPEILQRAEQDFEDALYIHLTRHPFATIYSFVEAKLDQVFFRHEHPFSRRVLAELVWTVGHQNIRRFLENVPAQRQHHVRFEDLVTRPTEVMRELSQFLDLPFDPALLRPYEGGRMTDGVRRGEQMAGDFKFYLRKEIDPRAAHRWTRLYTGDFLGDVGWEVAESLGYSRSSLPEETGESAAAEASALPENMVLQPVPRDGDLPLSFAQQRLWFLDQLEPGGSSYNIPSAVRFSGRLDVGALAQSLNEIVRRHEVLRTVFLTVDGKPRQRILSERVVPMPVVDLQKMPKAEQEAKIEKLVAKEARRPFDLANGPLVRATLLRLGPQEHVLLLTMHHIVSDGWSVGVLVREMAALYRAFSAGEPSFLPELPVQYADYAYWQRQWLQGDELASQMDYWREQLADLPPMLELPTDRPRPAVQTHAGATLWFELPPELSSAVKDLGRKQGASLYMTLLAAFQALLHRYTGQVDVSVGTPIAGRNHAALEGLIGFFVNTLVLRADLAGEPSFRELLERVRRMAVDAYANQDVPFEMLVDELQPQRDMSRTPLFQVMFTLQEAPLQTLRLPGLELSPLDADSGTAKFDLILSVVDRVDGLRASLEYNTDLFNQDTIERMAGHLQTLLEGIVADPERSVATLPLLTEAEREQMLVEWNDNGVDYPHDQTIPRLFEARAAQAPDVPAVVFEGQTLTYAELDRRANRLAHYLQELGVGPEELVGLCVERSPEMIVGLMGILKAGGAYLPLDPTYPEERLAFMLEDASVSVLLTQERLLEGLPIQPTNQLSILCLDADWSDIAQASGETPERELGPENLAYVIYTSGSTGRPKGAMISHRSALHLATALREVIYTDLPGAPLRLSLNAPLPFDASVQQLVMLTQGHTLHVVPEEARLDGQALLTFVRQNRLQVLDCVPTQLKLLLEAGLLDGSGWVPSAILPGGEAIDEEVWETLRAALATEFYNMYGPTECAVDSTIGRVKALGPRPTIGRPVPNARTYVLDGRLQPLPIGVPGELCIGGAGVGRGYLDRAGLTAEKFVPDPFSDEPGARLYRTGDLVRYRPDGSIEFLGRIDHQVKVRGFRIELGEIEAVLREHEAVKDAVAMAREDLSGATKRLVAYLMPEGEDVPTVTELRNFVKEKLPEYMVPSAFVTLEALPLLPNGKVNRRALPEPDQARPDLEAAFIAPRTEKERVLADVWSQILNVKKVGVHDNFFELGGDSILSIQVVSRVNRAGLKLTPRQLFEHPTVAGLATVAGTGPVIQAEQGIVEGPLPLTPIQHDFFERELPEPHHYNQAILLQVGQRLAPDLLEAAIGHLVAHHDALRLRFERVGVGGNSHPAVWRQVNAGLEDDIPFEWIDLSERPAAQQGPAVEERVAELQASLDLTAGPLLRVAYFDLGPERRDRLFMVIHHLAVDGVSWRILMEDLQTAYWQLAQGETVQLPLKTTSFQYWARRLNEYAQSETVREELAHWLALSDRSLTRLPLDLAPGPEANTEASERRVRASLTAEETQGLLQDVPAAYGTEINDALLAALAQALAAWTGHRTLFVDLEGHGREDLFDDVDLSRTVGWFTTLYPVALDLREVEGPGERLTAVKEQLRQVPRRGIGYGLLRYLSENEGIVERMRALPQPQVSFNYLGQFDQALPEASAFEPAPESAGPERSLQGRRSHALGISGSVRGGQLHLEWSYSENLHRRATVERLAEDFVAALRALVAHCQSDDAGGYTPSDFEDVDLSEEDVDALLTEISEAIGDD